MTHRPAAAPRFSPFGGFALEAAPGEGAISGAVQRPPATGFEESYRRHLVLEQRRAVLETIARELNPATTLGDIVDAAQELGWGDAMGELNLGDLAVALLGESDTGAPARDDAPSHDDDVSDLEDADDDGDGDADEAANDDVAEDADEEEEEERPVAKVAKGRSKKAAKAQASKARPAAKSKKKAAKAAAQQTVLPIVPPTPAGKKGSKKAAKKAAKVAPAPADDSEAMNLEQAAKLLVPLVKKLKEATMQDLEEQTGMGRRKLRFHIGQLVKHGRLKRHGMGRGTCYTVK